MTANKYNIRAKRLALDNLIRDRAWKAFLISFSQLSSAQGGGGIPIIPGGGGGSNGGDEDEDERRPGESSTASLCEAVVTCRHRLTAHRTLLHSLCDVPRDSSSSPPPPPPEVVRLVASACSPRSMLLRDPGTESTPLHVAIARGAGIDAIGALLEAPTTSIDARRDLLLALNSRGQTPLLDAARRGADEDVVRYLVDLDVDGSSLLAVGRDTSKRKERRRCQHGNNDVPLNYIASRESVFVGEGLDQPGDLLRHMIVRTYRAMLIRRFPPIFDDCNGIYKLKNDEPNDERANSALDDDHQTCLLQATIFCCTFISSKVASSILSYIIRNGLFHRERLDERTDHAGNLTLHIACLSDTTKFDQILKLGDRGECSLVYGINSEDCTLMEYLVKASPCIGAHLSKNFEGMLPLHCAIKCGKDWSQIQLLVDACPSSVKSFTSKGELPLHLALKHSSASDIMKLWNLYPEAASIVDRSTGLYPYQLAAIRGGGHQSHGKDKSSKKPKSTECASETSLSFFLLRECPCLLTASLLRNETAPII